MDSRTRRRRALLGLLAAGALIALMNQLWLPWIGRFLVVEDPLRTADVVVPMAGEQLRLPYSAELLEQGYVHWFGITEMWVDPNRVGPNYRYSEVTRWLAIELGVPAERIVVAPESVASTYAEARAIRRLAEEQGWHSVIVVTSPYHTRRTRLIMRDAFSGSTITLTVRAARPHWYTPDRWWQFDQGRRATGLEYAKLALYLLGYHRFEQ